MLWQPWGGTFELQPKMIDPYVILDALQKLEQLIYLFLVLLLLNLSLDYKIS